MRKQRRKAERGAGVPIRGLDVTPGVPPVRLRRFPDPDRVSGGSQSGHAHTHDFLALAFFESGGGSIRLAGRTWQTSSGDVYVIAPGEVVDSWLGTPGSERAAGWMVSFPAEILGESAPGSFLSWHAHPLLFPFVGSDAGGALRLSVPEDQRNAWSERLALLDDELGRKRDGYHEAVLALLTLVLVEVSRLAVDVVDDLRLKEEPLLAAVFDVIEKRYQEAISLRDVAEAVSLTPGHLTTVVQRKTGRTVLEWITERRMSAARRLLVETNFSAAEIAGMVGYDDAGYFGRVFKRAHGVTPVGWRRSSLR